MNNIIVAYIMIIYLFKFNIILIYHYIIIFYFIIIIRKLTLLKNEK